MAVNLKAPEGTWSRAPFVSHDGIDADGVRAEVKVVVGYGVVGAIEPSTSGKTNKISFTVRNTTWDPAGYSRDPAILALLEKAKETNEPINFRIETRRKPEISRDKPIESLDANRGLEIVKSLAAVKFEDDESWTISSDAVTRLDEDPAPAGGSGLVSANAQTPDQLGLTSTKKPTGGNSRNSDYEPAPYVARWRGQVNPGSIAVNVPITFFIEVLNYEKASGFTLDKDRRKEVATVLLKIANRLQKDIFVKKLDAEYTGLDLTAGSHTRARALLFESMRSFFPLTEEIATDAEAFAAWQKNLYSVSYAMWDWAIDVVEDYVN